MSSNPDHQNLLRGAGLLICGFAIIPVMDASAKDLIGQGYSPVLIAFARFALSAILLSPLLLRRGAAKQLVGAGALLQVIRAIMLAIATVLFFSALETMKMADALAVYFIYPFLITLMAPLLLSEKVGLRRFVAVLIGFCGSLLIIRPGFQEVPIGVYYVLVASVCFALFNVLTRRLTGMGDPWMTVFYQSIVGAIVLAIFVPGHWRMPDAGAMMLLGLMIAAAVIGHWLLIKAYAYAPASLLAPFGYFEMVSTVVIGYLWFTDLPDGPTWVGIGIIVATGIYISLRERKKKQTQEVPTKI